MVIRTIITHYSTSRYLKRQELWTCPLFVSAPNYVVCCSDRNRRHSLHAVFLVVFIEAKIIKHVDKKANIPFRKL